MAAVTFLDAAVITELVHARHAAVEAGQQLRVCQPQGRVQRVLDLTGVLSLLSPDPGAAADAGANENRAG
jgi:anti-anti-sigma factor